MPWRAVQVLFVACPTTRVFNRWPRFNSGKYGKMGKLNNIFLKVCQAVCWKFGHKKSRPMAA
jgi:hypothetical protein